MAAARDQVATFMITEPYRKAAQALQEHGFVLLLGEPAVGKSVIVLMLALAAADNWGRLTVKARSAGELVDRWNPNEPNQFFWVDDAFGAVRHEEQLAQEWARSMPHVLAAIGKGRRRSARRAQGRNEAVRSVRAARCGIRVACRNQGAELSPGVPVGLQSPDV
jgi:hypothetical protein